MPHYVREYRQLVRFLRSRTDSEFELAERAVGGNFEQGGAVQAGLVLDLAPSGAFSLIDVGCGSGRAAYALRDIERLDYLGTDVVPELLDHARNVAARPDWRFELVESLTIPAADQSADIVMLMSVFTHLTPIETATYLREVARTLKPKGVMIASFLDRDEPRHLACTRPKWRERVARFIGRDVMNTLTTQAALTASVEAAGLAVEQVIKELVYGHYVMIARHEP